MRKDTQQERQWAVHRFFDGESPDALRLSRTLSVMALQVGGALPTGYPCMVRKSVTEAPQQCTTYVT
jgi:hypothetical protein